MFGCIPYFMINNHYHLDSQGCSCLEARYIRKKILKISNISFTFQQNQEDQHLQLLSKYSGFGLSLSTEATTTWCRPECCKTLLISEDLPNNINRRFLQNKIRIRCLISNLYYSYICKLTRLTLYDPLTVKYIGKSSIF